MPKRSALKIALPLAAGLGLGLLLTKTSLFGTKTTPEPDYTTLANVGPGEEVEIRQYSPMIVASTTVEATSYKKASNKAFRRLAAYIFGSNLGNEEIGMTTPVYQKPQQHQGQETEMTAPVPQGKEKGGRWSMSFVMPSHYTMDTLPEPKDADITFNEVPAATVAVLQFRGSMDEKKAAQKAKELQEKLATSPWSPTSAARFARYDPPVTLPLFRRNEVLMEVSK